MSIEISGPPPTPPDYGKTVILCPVHREMKPATQDCVNRLVRDRGLQTGIARGVSLVSAARNILAKQFLSGPWERAIWIDDDMSFSVEEVDELVRQQTSQDYDILGSVYMERTGTGFCFSPFGEKGEVTEVLLPTPGNPVIPVVGVGFGLTVTTRRAFDLAQSQSKHPVHDYSDFGLGFFSHFDVVEESGEMTQLGEDYCFCWRVQAGGGRVGLHTNVMPLHIGEVPMNFWQWFAYRAQPRPTADNPGRAPLLNQQTRRPFGV